MHLGWSFFAGVEGSWPSIFSLRAGLACTFLWLVNFASTKVVLL